MAKLSSISISDWKGLDYALSNTHKTKEHFGDCSNVYILDGEVFRRPGHTLLGTARSGVIKSMCCYQTYIGEWYLLAFVEVAGTSIKVYLWDTTDEHAVPTPTDPSWVDITGALTITSGTKNVFSSCTFLNKLYFSNRISPICKWNDTGDIVDAAIPYKARILLSFGERLCLYNTQEEGEECYQRVRWPIVGSDPSTPASWTGAGSGFVDLITELGADQIMGAEKLGSDVIIYGEEHILTQRYVGGKQVFAFDPCVVNKGLIGQNALIAFPYAHLFVGRDNIYLYTGATNINAIGTPIVDHLFATMDPDLKWMTFMSYHEDSRLLFIFYPSIGSTSCNLYVCCDMVTGSWTKGTTLGYMCAARFRTTSALTIGGMGWQIGLENLSWRVGDALSGVNYPYCAYGCLDGRIVKANPLADKDDTTTYTGSFDTFDIIFTERPDTYLHFFELLLEHISSTSGVSIQWSNDEGNTWTGLTLIPAQTTMKAFWKDLDINELKVRFQISGIYAFKVRSLILNLLPGTQLL